jgi:hypothetical protein
LSLEGYTTGINSLAVGDFNGDGKQDIITANFLEGRLGQIYGNYVRVLRGQGNGTLDAYRRSDP